jgi:DNA modification methylase
LFHTILQSQRDVLSSQLPLADVINKIIQGDALSILKSLPDNLISCCVTSPPYFNVRDYKVDGQIGRESTVSEYIDKLIAVFNEVKRVLKKEGSLWVVIGDYYNDKCLACIPEHFAIKMIENGWILRNKIVYWKPNCMPSSVKDRFTIDWEYLYFFVKSQKYYFETQYESMVSNMTRNRKLPTFGGNKAAGYEQRIYSGKVWSHVKARGKRIKRCVWKIPTQPYSGGHYACFPEKLIETPIKAGSPMNGIILDPFAGTATTGIVALKNARKFICIELSRDYCKLAEEKLRPYLEQTLIPQYITS